MPLPDKILKDLQQAMRARDKQRTQTLRLLRAALKDAEIKAGQPLTDKDALNIIAREAKRCRVAIEEYGDLARQDKVDETQTELAVLEEYLPRQMARGEIEEIARQIIAEVSEPEPPQIGEVMRRLMPQLKGRADGRLANQIVRELLSDV